MGLIGRKKTKKKTKTTKKKKIAVKSTDLKRKKDGSRKKKTVKAGAPIKVKLNSPKKSKVERKSEQSSTKPIMGQEIEFDEETDVSREGTSENDLLVRKWKIIAEKMKKDTSESSSEKTEPESDSEDELVSSLISKNSSLFKPETYTSSEDQKKFARKKKDH